MFWGTFFFGSRGIFLCCGICAIPVGSGLGVNVVLQSTFLMTFTFELNCIRIVEIALSEVDAYKLSSCTSMSLNCMRMMIFILQDFCELSQV